MAKFYVGQRVRINCPESGSHGVETTIRAVNVYVGADWEEGPYVGHEVDIPCADEDGEFCAFEPHELEPLTNPGQKEFKAEDVLTLEGLPDFTIAMPKKEAA